MMGMISDDSRSYYQVLGISPDADAEEVRLAHRRLALALHPDRHAGKGEAERSLAGRRMREVNEAWTVLSNESQRREYDLSLGRVNAGAVHAHAGEQSTAESRSSTTGPGSRQRAPSWSSASEQPTDRGTSTGRSSADFDHLSHGRRVGDDGRPLRAVYFDAAETDDTAGWQRSLLRRGPIASILLVALALFLITAYAGSVSDSGSDPTPTQVAAKDCASRRGTERTAVRVPCSEPNDGRIVKEVDTAQECPAEASYVVIDNEMACISSVTTEVAPETATRPGG